MKFSCLASSSSGNCFYIENKDKSILIDAGISAKEILERLIKIGADANKIEGIFITHEHSDHIKGLDVLARKFQIPIFATAGTVKDSFLCSQADLIQPIKNSEILNLAGLEIRTYKKSHDAADPVFFQIRNEKTLSIITDAGKACENIEQSVNESDFLVMEANHDIDMLKSGPYPFYLKQRILSDKGHLSNLHSALCVLEHSSKKIKTVLLGHLSSTNNTPNLAKETFINFLKERSDLTPEIFVSRKDIPSNLVKIH